MYEINEKIVLIPTTYCPICDQVRVGRNLCQMVAHKMPGDGAWVANGVYCYEANREYCWPCVENGDTPSGYFTPEACGNYSGEGYHGVRTPDQLIVFKRVLHEFDRQRIWSHPPCKLDFHWWFLNHIVSPGRDDGWPK